MKSTAVNAPRWCVLCLCLLPAVGASADDAANPATIDEIVVTSERRGQPRLMHTGNIERLGAETIRDIGHQHAHELLQRAAGVWVSRGSGQEHLTAIRSPVLSGAGSCGAFLLLEDGIPIRPAGFCNVNQLLELNTEQAQAIEVLRGPGNALYGSNALHGIVNVLMPATGAAPRVGIEAGANDFLRVHARVPLADERAQAGFVYADDGGFRADSGYRQFKAQLRGSGELAGGELDIALSVSDLDQETAGFIFGEDAYLDPDLRRANLNPEAFREATSQRLYALWRGTRGDVDIDLRPYVRHSDMRFLQHFLPGQPLEENGHVSAGLLASATREHSSGHLSAGLDLEWADVFLRETQAGPTVGSPFLVETRPAGKHYDYRVDSIAAAPWVQAELAIAPDIVLSAGLRAEWLRYRYDNRMLDGNTRDDGTPCGFGGCLYSRPADRSDYFANLAPSIGVRYELSTDTSLYVNAARGFRAPQMTELYRLQSGQQVADLDSEHADSLEVGWRRIREGLALDVALYTLRKTDSVFRDAAGFNVSGARSRHRGIEVALQADLSPRWRLDIDGSWATHEYAFNRVAARGETFVSGRDVDTAPHFLGSAELHYRHEAFDARLQWTAIGDYFLDAENRFRYPGHELWNAALRVALPRRWSLHLRLNNLADTAYADRADYAFGNYRYFPGRGRELFVEVAWDAAD